MSQQTEILRSVTHWRSLKALVSQREGTRPGLTSQGLAWDWLGPWPLWVTLSKQRCTSPPPSPLWRAESGLSNLHWHHPTHHHLLWPFPAEHVCALAIAHFRETCLPPCHRTDLKHQQPRVSEHSDRTQPDRSSGRRQRLNHRHKEQGRAGWSVKAPEPAISPSGEHEDWGRGGSSDYFLITACQASLVFLRSRDCFIYFPLVSWPSSLPRY